MRFAVCILVCAACTRLNPDFALRPVSSAPDSAGPRDLGDPLPDFSGPPAGNPPCESGFHACGELCLADDSIDSCGSACTPCPTPAHGSAFCDSLLGCGFTCDPGFVVSGDACVAMAPVCAAHAAACSTGSNCCSGVCTSNKCACTNLGGTCTSNDDCCGFAACDPALHTCTCDPVGTPEPSDGSGGACCSGGLDGLNYKCEYTGTCATDADCRARTGHCQANGTCCDDKGGYCYSNSDCCSGSCFLGANAGSPGICQ